VVILAVQLVRPAPAPHVHGEAAAPPAFAPPVAPPARDYLAILAHPLFNPARDAGEAGGAELSAATSLSDYRLVGVASVGGRGEAVLRGPAGEVVSLRPGEALLGWRLAQVGPGGAVLEQGDVRRTVAPGASAAPKAAAP
jgi:hypothetical protein